MSTPQAGHSPGNILLPLPRRPRRGGTRGPATGEGPLAGGALTLAQLSELLWAGFELDRRGNGSRAPGAAHQRPTFEVYAILAEGTYRYDPLEHCLLPVTQHDLRACTGRHLSVATPLLTLAYVVDCTEPGEDAWEECGLVAGADASYVAANVAAWCAAAGLAAASRHVFDPRLAQELGLRPAQRIVLAQAVGVSRAAH